LPFGIIRELFLVVPAAVVGFMFSFDMSRYKSKERFRGSMRVRRFVVRG